METLPLPEIVATRLDEIAYKLIAQFGARLALIYTALLSTDPSFPPDDPRLGYLRRRCLEAGGARYVLDGDSFADGGQS